MNKWDSRFINLALTISTWSKDPKRKVGCVIVDDDHHILSTGYNGFPRSVDDTLVDNQEYKREIMIHAETNAMIRLPGTSADKMKTLYCTLFPCPACASLILQHNIKRIVVPQADLDHPHWGEKFKIALAMLLIRVTIDYWEDSDL